MSEDPRPSPPVGEATASLLGLSKGDEDARTRLFDLLYFELKRQAQAFFRHENPGHTLQPTALVHEAYLRLIDANQVDLTGQRSFTELAAQAMRRVLVDHARARLRDKRGGGRKRVEIDGDALTSPSGVDESDLLAIDEALSKLREKSERLAKLVELRFFGGLPREEIAEVLEISRATVARDWRIARAALTQLLQESDSS